MRIVTFPGVENDERSPTFDTLAPIDAGQHLEFAAQYRSEGIGRRPGGRRDD